MTILCFQGLKIPVSKITCAQFLFKPPALNTFIFLLLKNYFRLQPLVKLNTIIRICLLWLVDYTNKTNICIPQFSACHYHHLVFYNVSGQVLLHVKHINVLIHFPSFAHPSSPSPPPSALSGGNFKTIGTLQLRRDPKHRLLFQLNILSESCCASCSIWISLLL